ncbi:hypothetical protein [Oryzicola mucosus]|uniref:DUF945 domain-containing protein n=1 Tax=Oryzicola mucosus TaxID=2767425 RepID=A0A8J6U1A9_9HYPH|nr:hypothetical protein [Oryzicola mucosus]MBD0416711.1 hypothetical protein [Oryzicola mucosus]
MLHRSTVGKLTLSTFLLTVPLSSAFAQDATAIADRLQAALKTQSMDLSWDSVTGDAAETVLQGAKLSIQGPETPQVIPLGKLTLTGIEETDKGGYHIDMLTTDPYEVTERGSTITSSPVEIGGLVLPAPGATDPLESAMLYETLDVDNFTVKVGDKPAFTLDQLHVEMTPPTDGAAMEFSANVEKFTGDLSLVTDPNAKRAIEGLGYQTIDGFVEAEGTWQPSDGRMQLSQYDITVNNAGTLGMTFDLGGYTMDFLKSMQDLQKKMAEQPKGADTNAQSMAMLGLMQQLTLASATIRFDDDSLTGKILDYVAKQQGAKPEDIANQAKAILPFMSGQLQNPELAKQISTAVNAYLDDPQSLEIAAKPASPVPFAMIAANAMSNPVELTKTLAVTVTANQAAE